MPISDWSSDVCSSDLPSRSQTSSCSRVSFMVHSPCRPLSPWQALGYSFSQKRRLCKDSTGSGTVLAFFLARGRWAAIKDAKPGTRKGETEGRRDLQYEAAQVPEEGGRDLETRDRERRPRRPRTG